MSPALGPPSAAFTDARPERRLWSGRIPFAEQPTKAKEGREDEPPSMLGHS